MATLSALLSNFPILEGILSALPLGSLLDLSRVNSDYRAILHGFSLVNQVSGLQNTCSRLHIGQHQTAIWRHYKSLSQLECSERHHTKGNNIRGCRVCSMPVCEACIVKSSFGKKENAFRARTRRLCQECWVIGNPHAGSLQPEIHTIALLDYALSETCRCTAWDGTLCLRCKEQQNSEYIQQRDCCVGYGCKKDGLNDDSAASRICLWCHRVLPGRRRKEDWRKDYDSRHLILPVQYKESRAPSTSSSGRWTSFDDQRWITRKEDNSGSLHIETMIPERSGSKENRRHVTPDKVREQEAAETCVDFNEDNIIGDEVDDHTRATQSDLRRLKKPPDDDFIFVYHGDVEMFMTHSKADLAKMFSEE